MKYVFFGVILSFVAGSAAAVELNKEQLMQIAKDNNLCSGSELVDAFVEAPGSNTINVVCSGGTASFALPASFFPAVGALGGVTAGGAAILGSSVLAVIARANATPSTN